MSVFRKKRKNRYLLDYLSNKKDKIFAVFIMKK